MAQVHKFDTLYSRDSNGKIKSWRVEVEDGEVVRVRSFSGQLNGKQTPQVNELTEGKNSGRANETSPYQQGVKDAQSKWNKRKREGYKSLKDLGIAEDADIENSLEELLPQSNTNAEGNIIPMKAQWYYKDDANTIPKIKFPCFIQPKINGVRCFAIFENGNVFLRSKKGLEYTAPHHIITELKQTFYINPDNRSIIIDGELYIDDTILSEIVGAVRKPNLLTNAVRFHAFDLAIPDLSQGDRLNLLEDKMAEVCPHVVVVETKVVETHEQGIEYHKQFKAKGYEGSIFRDWKAHYRFGQRPSTMTKLKDRESLEFIIVDVVDTVNTPGLGMFVCRNDKNNETFKVVPEGGQELRRKYLIDRKNLLGKKLTVEFYERTDAPKEVPFHAVGIVVRDYE